MKTITSFIILAFVLLSSFLALVTSQQEHCTEVENISKTVCAAFVQNGCLIDLTITVGGNIVYNQNVTLLQISNSNNKVYCGTTDGCQLCFNWEETAIQKEGAKQGCITLTGSCTDETLYLGCFNDESVEVCDHACPNDCSGHGVCQTSGVCDCNDSYTTSDCSIQCNSSLHNLVKIESGTSYHMTSNFQFLGYVEAYSNLAYLAILGTSTTDGLDIYIKKSCYPDPSSGFYDSHINVAKRAMGGATVAQNCEDMNGGIWYILVVTSSSTATFSTTIQLETITVLQPNQMVTYDVKSPQSYYSFSLSHPAFTVEVTTKLLDPFTVSIMKTQCPTDSLSLFSVLEPLNLTIVSSNGDAHYLYKYVLASPSSPTGTYYMKVSDSAFHWGDQKIDHAYEISFTQNTCNDVCYFGACWSTSSCLCYTDWVGDICNMKISDMKTSFSSFTSVGDSPSSHSSSSNKEDEEEEVIAVALSTILLAAIIVVIVVCMIFILFIVVRIIRKKRRSKSDNIYDLLTSSEDNEHSF